VSKISYERLVEVANYCPVTGVFTSKVSRGPLKVGDQIGCINLNGYWQMCIDGALHYGHRLAFLWMEGEYPPRLVDHINGDRSDNRWSNLRHATAGVNAQNQRRPRIDNTSGLLGVSMHADGKWQARIKVGPNYKSLGLHDTKEAAHAAYVAAKKLHHEGNTL
jgi:hypothetical protein